jgi:hypothetical protein
MDPERFDRLSINEAQPTRRIVNSNPKTSYLNREKQSELQAYTVILSSTVRDFSASTVRDFYRTNAE